MGLDSSNENVKGYMRKLGSSQQLIDKKEKKITKLENLTQNTSNQNKIDKLKREIFECKGASMRYIEELKKLGYRSNSANDSELQNKAVIGVIMEGDDGNIEAEDDDSDGEGSRTDILSEDLRLSRAMGGLGISAPSLFPNPLQRADHPNPSDPPSPHFPLTRTPQTVPQLPPYGVVSPAPTYEESLRSGREELERKREQLGLLQQKELEESQRRLKLNQNPKYRLEYSDQVGLGLSFSEAQHPDIKNQLRKAHEEITEVNRKIETVNQALPQRPPPADTPMPDHQDYVWDDNTQQHVLKQHINLWEKEMLAFTIKDQQAERKKKKLRAEQTLKAAEEEILMKAYQTAVEENSIMYDKIYNMQKEQTRLKYENDRRFQVEREESERLKREIERSRARENQPVPGNPSPQPDPFYPLPIDRSNEGKISAAECLRFIDTLNEKGDVILWEKTLLTTSRSCRPDQIEMLIIGILNTRISTSLRGNINTHDIRTIQDLVEKVREVTIVTYTYAQLIIRLSKIKQTGSLMDYIVKFNTELEAVKHAKKMDNRKSGRDIRDTGDVEALSCQYFTLGLSERLSLALSARDPVSLGHAQEMARKIDITTEQYREHWKEDRRARTDRHGDRQKDSGRDRDSAYMRREQRSKKPRVPRSPSDENKIRTADNKHDGRKTDVCYKCGKSGHMSPQCPAANFRKDQHPKRPPQNPKIHHIPNPIRENESDDNLQSNVVESDSEQTVTDHETDASDKSESEEETYQ